MEGVGWGVIVPIPGATTEARVLENTKGCSVDGGGDAGD